MYKGEEGSHIFLFLISFSFFFSLSHLFSMVFLLGKDLNLKLIKGIRKGASGTKRSSVE